MYAKGKVVRFGNNDKTEEKYAPIQKLTEKISSAHQDEIDGYGV